MNLISSVSLNELISQPNNISYLLWDNGTL